MTFDIIDHEGNSLVDHEANNIVYSEPVTVVVPLLSLTITNFSVLISQLSHIIIRIRERDTNFSVIKRLSQLKIRNRKTKFTRIK